MVLNWQVHQLHVVLSKLLLNYCSVSTVSWLLLTYCISKPLWLLLNFLVYIHVYMCTCTYTMYMYIHVYIVILCFVSSCGSSLGSWYSMYILISYRESCILYLLNGICIAIFGNDHLEKVILEHLLDQYQVCYISVRGTLLLYLYVSLCLSIYISFSLSIYISFSLSLSLSLSLSHSLSLCLCLSHYSSYSLYNRRAENYYLQWLHQFYPWLDKTEDHHQYTMSL